MEIIIYDPHHPNDRSRAKTLTKEQFSIVHDYVVDCLNSRRKTPSERVVLAMLAEAGMPVRFDKERK